MEEITRVLELKRAKDEARKRYDEIQKRLDKEFVQRYEGLSREEIVDLCMELDTKYGVEKAYEEFANKAGEYMKAALEFAKREAKKYRPDAISEIEEIQRVLGTEYEIIYRDQILHVLDRLVMLLGGVRVGKV